MPLIPPPGRWRLQGRGQDVSHSPPPPPLHTWPQVPGSGFSARFRFRQTDGGTAGSFAVLLPLAPPHGRFPKAPWAKAFVAWRAQSPMPAGWGTCALARGSTRKEFFCLCISWHCLLRLPGLLSGLRNAAFSVQGIQWAWFLASNRCGQQGNRAPVTGLTLPSSPAGWMVTESAAGKRTQDVEFPDENDSSTWGLWSR